MEEFVALVEAMGGNIDEDGAEKTLSALDPLSRGTIGFNAFKSWWSVMVETCPERTGLILPHTGDDESPMREYRYEGAESSADGIDIWSRDVLQLFETRDSLCGGKFTLSLTTGEGDSDSDEYIKNNWKKRVIYTGEYEEATGGSKIIMTADSHETREREDEFSYAGDAVAAEPCEAHFAALEGLDGYFLAGECLDHHHPDGVSLTEMRVAGREPHHGDLHGIEAYDSYFKDGNGESTPYWDFKNGGVNGPSSWASLSPKYALASEGQAQSPIDIIKSEATTGNHLNRLGSVYSGSMLGQLSLNGKHLQIKPEARNLDLGGELFQLSNVSFRTPSEHKLNGREYPLEMHMVHVQSSTNKIAIVSVLFASSPSKSKDGSSKFLNGIWRMIPSHGIKDMVEDCPDLDFDALSLDTQPYFRYEGSLTSPPCTEGVTWIVMEKPENASMQQLEKFKGAMKEKPCARPCQPLNGRQVFAWNSSMTYVPPPDTTSSNAVSETEWRPVNATYYF